MTRPKPANPFRWLRRLASLALSLCIVAAANAEWSGECDEKDPFTSARYAPPDVTLMLEVRGAAGLRRSLADRPILTWLKDLVDAEEMELVWSGLAEQTGLPRGVLFDSCLGGRFTLFARSEGDGLGEWALVAETHPFRLKKVFERLNPTIIGPAAGMTLSEIPEHQLLLARDDRSLVVGPKTRRTLFDEVVERVGRANEHRDDDRRWDRDDDRDEHLEDTLAGSREMRRAMSIGGGRIELFVRHGGMIGGWSALAASIHGDDVTLNHIARFDNSPLTGEITRLAVHPSLLAAFEERSLITLAMPTDIGDGPLSAYVQAKLGEPLLSPALRRNRGDVQVVSIGEVEGRLEPNAVDLLVPTFAVCLELLDPATAGDDLDDHMMRIARRIEQNAEGNLLVRLDRIGQGPAAGSRHVDLAGAGDWLSGGFPILKNVSLNWTVAPGPDRTSFAVIATHPDQMEAAVTSLATAAREGEPCQRLSHAGSIDGVRLSHHLLSYAAQAEALVGPEAADEFQQSLEMLAHLCAGMDRARWTMTRPCSEEMRVEAKIRLTPNPSASDAEPKQRGKRGKTGKRQDDDCPRGQESHCPDA